MGRWQSYWFVHGGRLSAALLRVALAVSLGVTLWRLGGDPPPAAPSPYVPLAPWPTLEATLELSPLDPRALDGIWLLAWLATGALLLGFGSRAAAAIALAATAALIALSPGPTAPLVDGAPLVALAAFLGARGGDTLGLDALFRRLRGRSPLVVREGYVWSVRLVQIAVALVPATVALEALRAGAGPSLELGAMFLPLGAIVVVRWPWLRALLGAGFLVAPLAHGVRTDDWTGWPLAWLPLAVVFVDWDALVDWIATRVRRERALSPPAMPYHHWVATLFILLVLAGEAALAYLIVTR